MANHVSATAPEETPHVNQPFNNALKRRAQSLIKDRSVDKQSRAILRYGLETNDPWLAELVRRADVGETIIDTVDFSQTPATTEHDRHLVRSGDGQRLPRRASNERGIGQNVL